MPAPQGLFRFPGVAQIIDGSITISHGINPSVARLKIAPQSGLILTDGTLTLTFGTSFQVKFPGCRVNTPSIVKGLDGRVMEFSVQDRRWKWAYGEIYARYNLKKADGTVDTLNSEEKTPQEIATECLKKMGEQGYNVSALPNKTRPEKIWDGANPADELAQLCDELGCRVVLGLDNKVRIVKLGTGAQLPASPTRRTTGYGLSLTGIPDSLKVVTGPQQYQTKLKLEAVGDDADGRIRPVNELSYKPSSGWANQSPDGFFGVENKANRRLALRSVWRKYRIKSQADGSMHPPEFPKDVAIKSINQFLPISGRLLEQKLDQQRDQQDLQTTSFLPAFIEGVFLKRDYSFGSSLEFSDIQKGATTDSKGNTFIGARYVGGFSIDEERGIVELSDWVVKRAAAGGYEAAELYLTCSYSVKNKENLPRRYGFEKKITKRPQNTGPRIIPAPDINLQVIARYGKDGKKISKVFSNQAKVDEWCQELINSTEVEYQAPQTEQVEYAGWLPINLDGAVQQVSYTFSISEGAKTHASRNTEFDPVVPPYKRLREQQRVKLIQGLQFKELVITGAR